MRYSALNVFFRYFLFKILLLAVPTFGHTQEKTFELEHQIVSVTIPRGWEVVDELLGQDLTFFGPFEKESRPVISISALNTFDGSFSLAQMRRRESDYRKGRMDFIQKYNAELVKFIPYERVSWPFLDEVHQVGYQYKHQGQEFIEINYYYKCDRQLHMASSLLTVVEDALHGPQVKQLLQSIKCSAKPKS